MYTTLETPSGIIAPLKLNDFEFHRRYLAWKEKENVRRKKAKLHDTDTRRALYYLRNYGSDKVADMDRDAREERLAKEEREAERIATMMAMEAARAVQIELGLTRRE